MKNAWGIVGVILLSLSFVMPLADAVPHTIYGYAYFEDGTPAVNASVTVINVDSGVKIENVTVVDKDGFYYFDVGSPGPNWGDGEVINVIIKSMDGKQLKGNATLKLDFKRPNQRMPDIYLETQNPHQNTPSFLFSYAMVSVILIYFLHKKRNRNL